jgi:hypothetical protein
MSSHSRRQFFHLKVCSKHSSGETQKSPVFVKYFVTYLFNGNVIYALFAIPFAGDAV